MPAHIDRLNQNKRVEYGLCFSKLYVAYTTDISAYSKSVISIAFLTRLQMDLIDMHSMILTYVKDHFSKYQWIFALPSKEGIHVLSLIYAIFLIHLSHEEYESYNLTTAKNLYKTHFKIKFTQLFFHYFEY
jgi:hypothetical protein